MSDCEKKLDALIDALGFDVEEVRDIKPYYHPDDMQSNGEPKVNARCERIVNNSYKLTKRTYSKNPPLHRTVRLYEKGDISAVEMIRDIMWAEGVTDEEI